MFLLFSVPFCVEIISTRSAFYMLTVTLYFNLVPENRFENIGLSTTKTFRVFISEFVKFILDLQRRNSTLNSSIRNTNIKLYDLHTCIRSVYSNRLMCCKKKRNFAAYC